MGEEECWGLEGGWVFEVSEGKWRDLMTRFEYADYSTVVVIVISSRDGY